MKTGIVKSNEYFKHQMGAFHPESPNRLKVIYDMIERDFSMSAESSPFVFISPRKATQEELMLIHTPSYIKIIEQTKDKGRVILDPDTSTNAETYDVACLAVGGVLEAIDKIMKGEVRNAFALIRPPGHHAERNRAMGFCFFNNVAIGAEYLIRKYKLKRVLIVDWDLHHGNGTQNAFYSRSDVLYFSTHQFPYYPGTGRGDEVGTGGGEGYTVNIPLSSGKDDKDFLYIFQNILSPIAEQFKPEFIIVSCGFDICAGDPLGGMKVTSEGFGALALELKKIAEKFCQGRLLLVLEGGYSLDCLRKGVKEILKVLSGQVKSYEIKGEISSDLLKELEPKIRIHRKYWKLNN
ncbi:histone deacetylase [Candidatus Aminicenantes bacterium AC-708-M15]|nr:histone deacetylase [SCandidatus Aminicenantes bacterium Aminicenantia_JdfR_composite]MCP2598211.1 histone deacetylase [Candidatus Aminicenantes bacterium AC-335-L06]MCP2603956.1 histone deacetylase [Candidatus Aminicenantes bacterium AC-708-M15]MCP2605588.1 histone deacetylase [Candidatus Aminicenantes bacterium AC-335-O07]